MIGVLIMMIVGLVVLAMIGNAMALVSHPLESFSNFSSLKESGIFPKKVIETSYYVKPNLKSTRLRYANLLSVFLISAYSELCRDGTSLHKSFLDNLYDGADPVSDWLGYSAAQLKEAAKSAAQIVSERKPKLKRLSKEELADLTVCFFYAALKKIGREYGAEVKSKEARDKMDIFSSFEHEIDNDKSDSQLKSLFFIFYSLKCGLALNTTSAHTYESTQSSDYYATEKKHEIYANYAAGTTYSGFKLKSEKEHAIYILKDYEKNELYGIAAPDMLK